MALFETYKASLLISWVMYVEMFYLNMHSITA